MTLETRTRIFVTVARPLLLYAMLSTAFPAIPHSPQINPLICDAVIFCGIGFYIQLVAERKTK